MRLFLSCTELGLGHVNRIIPLGKKLKEKGHELYFYSGGTAYQILRNEFENVWQCTPVAWYETAHGVIASASLLNILFPLPYFNHSNNKVKMKSSSGLETVHRYYDLRRNIKKIKPDIIISDGDMHALRLAHRWKIPSVYITNIIRPSYGLSPLLVPGERFTERYVKNCTRIIVPDNPQPYTICEYNLGNLNQLQIEDKVEFVGSFIDMTPTHGSEKHFFAPISGPYGTRAKLAQTVIPMLRELEIRSIVSLGEPGRKITKKMGKCEIHTWLTQAERHEIMKNADLILFSGGHATCFETIKHGKPSICLPTQPEQMGNARKMQELSCSLTAENKSQLKLAIQEIESRRKFYKSNARELNVNSAKFRGVEQATRVIEEMGEK